MLKLMKQMPCTVGGGGGGAAAAAVQIMPLGDDLRNLKDKVMIMAFCQLIQGSL